MTVSMSPVQTRTPQTTESPDEEFPEIEEIQYVNWIDQHRKIRAQLCRMLDILVCIPTHTFLHYTFPNPDDNNNTSSTVAPNQIDEAKGTITNATSGYIPNVGGMQTCCVCMDL